MKQYRFILLLISLASLYYSNSALSFTQNITSINLTSLKETVIALDVTRKKSQQELDKINKTSPSGRVYEYSVFIEYLSHQINDYCWQIYNQYSLEAVSDLPCEITKNQNQSPVIHRDKKDAVLTGEEQIESLDKEFLTLLGDFDEMLLLEDQLIAEQRKNKPSSAEKDKGHKNGELTDASNDKEKNRQSKQKNSKTKQEIFNPNNGKNSQSKQGSSSTRGNQKKYSKEKMNEIRKLNKIDDDIVARQLKEAAEKEKNPELQEKLWEEYYKYKRKYIK